MSDVIREFLVSLGYKVDASGEKRFTDGIKTATKTVMELGLAAGATAVALGAAVAKMAEQLDGLYFASQRTKAAAENIKALGFAADQMGSSADAAQGSLENFAKFLAINPNGENLVRSWGIQTRDVNGQLRDTTQIMNDLGGLFRKLGPAQAYRRSEVLGIDYKTMLALMNGMDGFEDRYKQILARYGLDTKKAAEQSHQFMLRMRDLRANADVLGTVIGTHLIGVFDELEYRWNSLDSTTQSNIESFGKWAAAIVAGAAVIAGGPVVWIGALAAAIGLLWDDYRVWKEGGKSLIDWGKWKPEIDLAKAGIDLIGDGLNNLVAIGKAAWPHMVGGWHDLTAAIKDAYEWIMKIIHAVEGSKAFQWVMEKSQGIRAGITNAFDQAKGWVLNKTKGPRDSIAQLYAQTGIVDRVKNFGSEVQAGVDTDQEATDRSNAADALGQLWRQLTGQPYDHGTPDQAPPAAGRPSDQSSGATDQAPLGVRDNNPGNLRTGPGGSFGNYATPEQGLQALSHQLGLYFNGQSAAAGYRHLQTLRDILSTYAPKSENDTGAYIADVAKQMGVSPDAQLNLNDPQVMASLMRGIIQHEDGYNPYSSEMIDHAAGNQASAAPSIAGVSLEQKTYITVSGTDKPQETARAVASEQNTVNQRLARNFQFATAT
ncbi:hypothetical protein [Dyella mobilis]|uniref:Uncharacterized protein n=1 Tax=Dyella mobilis TaxID=1849582 RepID=A0ABS2KK58_9GAMM|nr:hypothetical protein [Dyella mobilis]MBM7131550.1 hypothetical protein [Dyella mobilis]GLQ96479.1 hypothetical protein GCM10007863_08970 [Dyella mobilis]